jgi:site-specific recombinase XerD
MASISLKRRGRHIHLLYTHRKKKWQFSTGVEIEPKWWNDHTKWVKQTYPYFYQVEQALRKEIEKVESARRGVEAHGKEPYPNIVRAHIQERNQLTETNYNLLQYFFDDQVRKRSLSHGTVKRYRVAIRHLLGFDISNKQLEPNILEDYHNYCLKCFKSDNTIEKRVYFLKAFLEWCFKHDYISFKPEYHLKRTTPDPVSLDSKELEALANVELHQEFDECRDIFLFCAATSLAFADYLRVAKNTHWIQDGVIYNPGRQKTGTPQSIPINDTAEYLLNKYNYQLPTRAMQVVNRNLKTIAWKADIKAPVTIKKYLNSRPYYETWEKWELLSIHKARKTFATLGLQKGLQPFAIKEMGGWKDWQSMKPYIDKVETDYLKEEMKKWNK